MMIRLNSRALAVFFVATLSSAPAFLSAQAVAESGPTTTSSSHPVVSKNAEPASGGAKNVQPGPARDPKTAPKNGKKPSLPGDRPLESLLGMTLVEATAEFGAPQQVFPVRGKQAWEDDVVFYYSDHSYLFWFRNRVWQVRVDRRFSGTVLGVRMGETKATVGRVLGNPFHVGSDSEIFLLPNRGFPVRARLFFTDDKLSDLYVYRGDF